MPSGVALGGASCAALDVMNAQLRPRSCPACGEKFVPWNLWRVSRWSCISCPHCATKLNRRYDVQLFVMLAAYSLIWTALIFALVWFVGLSLVTLISAIIVPPIALYLVDVATVRLVPAREWRGWLRGYDA